MKSSSWMAAFTASVVACSAPSSPTDVTVPTDTGIVLGDSGSDASTDGTLDVASDVEPADAVAADGATTDATRGETTTTMIAAATGGETRSADGLFRLHVFPGGVALDTAISITRLADAELPPEVRAANPVGGAVYAVEPDGLRFTGPGAYAWFHFASTPAGLITAGTAPRYAQLQLVAQPRAGGAIESYLRSQTHYNGGTGSLDVVGQLEHLSLQFVAHTDGTSIQVNFHGDEPHYVGDTWWASDLVLRLPRDLPGPMASRLAIENAYIDVLSGSAFLDVTTYDDLTGEPLDRLAFNEISNRWEIQQRSIRSLRLPSVLDPIVEFRPRPPSFTCLNAFSARPGIWLEGKYQRGRALSVVVTTPTRCENPPIGAVRIVQTTRGEREDLAIASPTTPVITAQATWGASSTTTTALARREWFVVTQRTADPPAPGPATITATNSGATMTATRDAAGSYTCSFDDVSRWNAGAPTRFGAGVDARDVAAPSGPAFTFGPVAGLDTEIRPEPGSPPIELSVCGAAPWSCRTESARCFFRTIDPSATAVRVRDGFDAMATRCGVTVDSLIAQDFYINVSTVNDATATIGGVSTRVSAGHTTQINGRDLLATCSGARPTFCRGSCVNLATDPMNCGACGRTGTEVCDGLDNDCDGTVDEGCPTSIAWPGGTNETSPLLGDTTSATDGLATAGCTFVNPLIGLCGTVNTDGTIRSLRATCGIMTLLTDRSVRPFRYTIDVVEVAPAGGCESGSGGGPSGGSSFTLRCPPGMVIDGITGVSAAPGRIGQIAPRCSQWVVAQDVTRRWVIRPGMRGSSTPASAGTAAGTMFSWTVPDDATTDNPGAIRNVRVRYRLGSVDPGVYWIQALGDSAFLL
ncbi:MAG: hypothetical protein JNK05_31930 [Myxococcales bacterium]|nr:hypothetical protein [Myxococcales bacterium]